MALAAALIARLPKLDGHQLPGARNRAAAP
jgi:hypothetical protein